jgi:transcriptional regulator with XRE-family HTH domain
MKFGEKVRDLRKKHSLTQDELAQCLGINKRTIIGWERDGRYPRSVEMLEKMADIFHVPLTYLQPDQSLFIERAAEAYGKKGKMLIEKMNATFPLYHSIFFQLLPTFS